MNFKEILNAKFLDWKDDFSFSGFEHDTRKDLKNKFYVAIKGENFDGNDFILEAKKKGASAVISNKNINIGIPHIVVKDSIEAYGVLAKNYLKELKYEKIIAITGSNGKTTTKEIIDFVLSKKFKVVKNPGNFNNLIGVPYSILNFPKSFDYGILELGMSSFGEIKALSEIVNPDLGLITNIGRAHIGFLKTKENILKAKMELFDYLEENNKEAIFVNNLDSLIKKEVDKLKIKKNIFGDSNFFIEKKNEAFDHQKYTLNYNNKKYSGRTSLLGDYNLNNILASLSVLNYLGIDIEESISLISDFIPSSMRSVFKKIDGVNYFIDCYNANPDSVIEALKVASTFSSRKIAVLGDMLELGDKSKSLHLEVGKKVAELYEYIFALGDFSKDYVDGFISAGGVLQKAFIFKKNEIAILKEKLKKMIIEDDFIFIKASRGIKIERVLED